MEMVQLNSVKTHLFTKVFLNRVDKTKQFAYTYILTSTGLFAQRFFISDTIMCPPSTARITHSISVSWTGKSLGATKRNVIALQL